MADAESPVELDGLLPVPRTAGIRRASAEFPRSGLWLSMPLTRPCRW